MAKCALTRAERYMSFRQFKGSRCLANGLIRILRTSARKLLVHNVLNESSYDALQKEVVDCGFTSHSNGRSFQRDYTWLGPSLSPQIIDPVPLLGSQSSSLPIGSQSPSRSLSRASAYQSDHRHLHRSQRRLLPPIGSLSPSRFSVVIRAQSDR